MPAPQQLELPITLSVSGTTESTGTVRCIQWNKSARVKRAALAAGSIIALSCALLLIPVVHLFVVPLLVFGLPIATIWYYVQSERRLGGTGSCPQCKKTLTILSGRSEQTFFQICPACQAYIRITLTNSPSTQ